MEHRVKSPEELPGVAGELINMFSDERVYVFYGKMGAGKTTFIKAICQYLGVEDVVSSPTFALINEYVTSAGEQVYHFDFYRIKNAYEALDIGFEEYLYSGAYCLVEWPEKVDGLLPGKHVAVRIEEQGQGIRKITAGEV